jgi:hypothetical protein
MSRIIPSLDNDGLHSHIPTIFNCIPITLEYTNTALYYKTKVCRSSMLKLEETFPQKQEKNSKSLETTRLPNANKAVLLEPSPRKIQTTPRLRKAAEVPPNLDLCKMWRGSAPGQMGGCCS